MQGPQISFSNSLCFPCLTENFPSANLSDLRMCHMQNFGKHIQFLGRNLDISLQILQYP